MDQLNLNNFHRPSLQKYFGENQIKIRTLVEFMWIFKGLEPWFPWQQDSLLCPLIYTFLEHVDDNKHISENKIKNGHSIDFSDFFFKV